MALTANRIPWNSVLTHHTILCKYHEKHNPSSSMVNRIQISRNGMGHSLLPEGSALSNEGLQCLYGIPFRFISKNPFFLCKSSRANNTEEKGCDTTYDDVTDITGSLTKAKKGNHIPYGQGLAGVRRFAHEDVKFLNDRALSDISLLSCPVLIETPWSVHWKRSLSLKHPLVTAIRGINHLVAWELHNQSGMMTLEDRVRQDAAFLGMEFLKLDG